jgi:anti-sigma regulatory factor (Ser/Thr protein kinase)
MAGVDDDRALLSLELPGRAEAAAAARQALTSLNGSLHLVSEARLRDAQLLVSELVANAVGHSGPGQTPVRLIVHATAQVVRVDVIDHGAGFDPTTLPAPSLDRGGRWGLPIVSSLAHRWGVVRGPKTTVWFEIDRPGRETPLTATLTDPTAQPVPGEQRAATGSQDH